MRQAALAVLCGCGRIAFDPIGADGDAAGGDGQRDGATDPATLNPIAWWKLDEMMGTVCADSIGPTDGMLRAGSSATFPSWDGMAHTGASALRFIGDGDHVLAIAPPALGDLAQLSISAWIRPSSVIANAGEKCVFDKGIPTAGYAFVIAQYGTGSIAFEAYFGASMAVHSSQPNLIVPDVWQHVVVTWDGSPNATGIHIYVDGNEVVYGTTMSATPPRPSDATLDANINCAAAQSMPGLIDDVLVFNRILTLAEVVQLSGS